MNRITFSTLLIAALTAGASNAQNADDVPVHEEVWELSPGQSSAYIGKISKSIIALDNLKKLAEVDEYKDVYAEGETLHARVKFWHHVALDSVALDHTPQEDGDASPSQGGPTRTSRALAMVQIAVFDALNAAQHGYTPFSSAIKQQVFKQASADAAVAFAAHRTLRALYPQQRARLREILDQEKVRIKSDTSTASFVAGKALGILASKLIRKKRRGDRSRNSEPNFGEGGRVADGTTTFFGTQVNGGSELVGEWTPDPNTPESSGDFNLALGAYWGNVKPFFLEGGDQFRVPVPPSIGSSLYAESFDQVAAKGGSPENTQTPSTSTEQTRFVGNFWGYDGVPLLGVPPRIYNQIVAQIGSEQLSDALDFARLLALVNVGMADAAIAAWDSKYYYNFWRPVTGVRRDDGVANTENDPSWNPVGISVINTDLPVRVTPPFPAYPSGHATFGATVFEILRDNFGDDTAFTFTSDEYDGTGFDPFFPDVPRPLVPVRFQTFTQAQEQNGISRIYNGAHWEFDDSAGQELGLKIARFLLDNTAAFRKK